jgi:hypothetical protein
MRLGALAFLFGILFRPYLIRLGQSAYRLLFLFALGFLWTVWRMNMILAQKLPQHRCVIAKANLRGD